MDISTRKPNTIYRVAFCKASYSLQYCCDFFTAAVIDDTRGTAFQDEAGTNLPPTAPDNWSPITRSWSPGFHEWNFSIVELTLKGPLNFEISLPDLNYVVSLVKIWMDQLIVRLTLIQPHLCSHLYVYWRPNTVGASDLWGPSALLSLCVDKYIRLTNNQQSQT